MHTRVIQSVETTKSKIYVLPLCNTASCVRYNATPTLKKEAMHSWQKKPEKKFNYILFRKHTLVSSLNWDGLKLVISFKKMREPFKILKFSGKETRFYKITLFWNASFQHKIFRCESFRARLNVSFLQNFSCKNHMNVVFSEQKHFLK